MIITLSFFVVITSLIAIAIYITKHQQKAFILKISKYKIGDTIKFGDYKYDGHIVNIVNIKEGTLKKWSETHFIAISSDKEYYRTWDNFKTNVSYEQRITEREEIKIKSKCSEYMSKNNKYI